MEVRSLKCKDVPYLEQITEDHPLANEAKAAVLEIRAANRQPVEVTPDTSQ